MNGVEFPGTYADDRGVERIVWRADPRRAGLPGYPGYELRTTIRGIAFSGHDFDGLDPDDESAAGDSGLSVGPGGLDNCVLSGTLPCVVESNGERSMRQVAFSLDLRPEARANRAAPLNLTLSFIEGDQRVTVHDDWFEDGLQKLEAALPNEIRLVCCVTCLYSDYSPGGHGLMGMSCHRDAKAQYLAVQTKTDYWTVPVTEEVMETYVCSEYERRIPGTGYRG